MKTIAIINLMLEAQVLTVELSRLSESWSQRYIKRQKPQLNCRKRSNLPKLKTKTSHNSFSNSGRQVLCFRPKIYMTTLTLELPLIMTLSIVDSKIATKSSSNHLR